MNIGRRALFRLLAAACAALALAVLSQSAAAAALQVTQASSGFPHQALVVSGPGIASLSPSRVHIVENGTPVPGVTVHSLRQPSSNDFGIVLVIDVSPNVSAIEHAVNAARGLAAQRPSQGALGIVEADASPPVALQLTRNASAVDNALATPPVISRHGQHMYDAVLTAVGMLRAANIAAGSVIVLSDGADRGDPATLQQILTSAEVGHIRIFSVGIASPRFDAQPLTALAEPTGGQFIEGGSGQLSQIFTAIESRLSSAYLIRYVSAQKAGERIPASLRIDGVPGTYDISYSSPAGGVSAGRQSPVPRQRFWASVTAALLVSIVCAILFGIAVWALISRRQSVRERLQGFVNTPSPKASASRQRTLVQRALGEARLRRRRRSPWLDALILELDVARIDISPLRLFLLTIAGTAVLTFAFVSLTSSPFAAIVIVLAPVAVRMAIRTLANRQRRQFEEQLPDNLQVIASALRAGHTFVGALGVMVEDAPEPSGRELRRALADEKLGVPLVDALNHVSMRMQSTDFRQVSLVATLQRDTGGNTAEVIDVVTDTIRDRLGLRRMIRSLTAQGRLSGLILTLLPAGLLFLVTLINPGYERPMFHSALGIIALALGAVMVAVGSLIIRRIVNIEV
jgi:tight adherence protein B